MSKTVKDILKWKESKQEFGLGIDGYVCFFMELVDNYESKINGNKRNIKTIKRSNLDKEATDYVIHQLFIINENAARELMNGLGMEDPYISEENKSHLENKSKF
ncbi:hypothetical protein BCR24_13935 [Enterococcus ureilyticus]|uniref:Uncharacterized protein n=1 Tax=Enterococcus ureilyticus TaxID=1131292 RepID=A0A1E5HDD9_9ENTE|nr:hypothetical protein [Enterococcus ureilyticus]MBM7689998.1 hypothetical protein [Enterococcus ureilyticus]OEG22951.1 hypothetical protein BCR24_13935 [Enterococcus ureilyticus]